MLVQFEKVKRLENEEIKLPERSTVNSAGYDFFAIENIVIPAKTTVRVFTRLKCKLLPDMFLLLANRSSNPAKKSLVLMNGIGIIDADYYGNPDNDGEMAFDFHNISTVDTIIKKGDKLGQGVIVKFIKTDDDYIANPTATRVGGFGSTGD
jgi:dUTP pyrophosphatase